MSTPDLNPTNSPATPSAPVAPATFAETVEPGSQAAKTLNSYWRSNLWIMAGLLIVWASVGLGCGVLFADSLNKFRLFDTGYPLGFWFAHQGSIVTFVLIVLTYALMMNRVEARHHRELKALKAQGEAGDGR